MKRLTASRPAAAAFQLILMLSASAAAALVPLLVPARNMLFKALLQWITLPLLGGFRSGVAARSGISHYLAWLMPPIIVAAVPWLIVGYPLQPGVMLICCLTSMIGASTGEVLRRRAL